MKVAGTWLPRCGKCGQVPIVTLGWPTRWDYKVTCCNIACDNATLVMGSEDGACRAWTRIQERISDDD